MAAATVTNFFWAEEIKRGPTVKITTTRPTQDVATTANPVAKALDEMVMRLEHMRRLKANWDSYGAAPPAKHAITLMQRLIGRIVIEHLAHIGIRSIPFVVVPTPEGGIQSEWRGESGKFIEVEIDPTGVLSYLVLTDKNSKPEERHSIADREVLEQIFSVVS